MARFSPTGPYYACLDHSHFCVAQQLIAEGGRKLYDQEDGIRLELKEDDEEGGGTSARASEPERTARSKDMCDSPVVEGPCFI